MGLVAFTLHYGCGGTNDSGSADDGVGIDGSGGASSPSGTATGTGVGTGTSTSSGTGTSTGTGFGVSPPMGEPPREPPRVTCEDLDDSVPLVLYLSPDDSNSVASPARAREALLQGMAPDGIRTYEFLNFYHVDYAAPNEGQLNVFADLAPTADPSELSLQIGVRSHDPVLPRRPITITFVLDTSGSMEGQPIERERAAVKAIASVLQAGDIVNMVTWNTTNAVVMAAHVVSGPNDPAVILAANGLSAGGGTDLHGGLVAGYALASQTYGPTRLNRVVLISDGGANAGITEAGLIGLHAQDADKEGIYLVGVGAGPLFGYHDALMDVVTDAGRGAYVYLDSVAAADELLADRFDEVMEVAARGVQIELTLPWYFQMHEFFGEEYSENPTEIEPQHLAPGDAMVLGQVLKACDPTIVNEDDTITVKVTWTAPLSYLAKETQLTATIGSLLGAPSPAHVKGKAIIAYAEALKAGTPAELLAAAETVAQANPGGLDAELNGILALIQNHPAYGP